MHADAGVLIPWQFILLHKKKSHVTNSIWTWYDDGQGYCYSLVSSPLSCGSPAYEELLVAYVLTQNQRPINNVNANKQTFCCSILVEYCSLIIGSIILFSNYR